MKVTSEAAKITKTIVDAAWRRRAANARLVVRDKDTAGLALIVNATTMTWTFSYRPRGQDPDTGRRWPNKALTLGNPSSLSVDDARHAAAALKGKAAAGGDPHADEMKRRAKAAAERAETVSRLLDRYESALPSRPKLRGEGPLTSKHAREELAHARAATATMGVDKKPIAEVGTVDLRRLLIEEARRPATARRRFGAFARFCDWVVDEGQLGANPCATIGKNWRPKPAPSRSTYPALGDMATIWRAAEKLAPTFRDLTRFLLCVPCRKGEATRLEWQHLNLAGAAWSQPGRMTKNREDHKLHLHPLALAILEARHKEAGGPKIGLVFPAPRSGKPVDNFTDMKKTIDRETGFSAWTWHDFRRSFASVLGEAGLPEPVLDACLNHRQSATRSGVLGVYQRAQRWPEQVSAMTAWGEALHVAFEMENPGACSPSKVSAK